MTSRKNLEAPRTAKKIATPQSVLPPPLPSSTWPNQVRSLAEEDETKIVEKAMQEAKKQIFLERTRHFIKAAKREIEGIENSFTSHLLTELNNYRGHPGFRVKIWFAFIDWYSTYRISSIYGAGSTVIPTQYFSNEAVIGQSLSPKANEKILNKFLEWAKKAIEPYEIFIAKIQDSEILIGVSAEAFLRISREVEGSPQ